MTHPRTFSSILLDIRRVYPHSIVVGKAVECLLDLVEAFGVALTALVAEVTATLALLCANSREMAVRKYARSVRMKLRSMRLTLRACEGEIPRMSIDLNACPLPHTSAHQALKIVGKAPSTKALMSAITYASLDKQKNFQEGTREVSGCQKSELSHKRWPVPRRPSACTAICM